MAQHIFLTGASGFVGTHVLHALRARGYPIKTLVRKPGSLKVSDPLITEVVGTLDDHAPLVAAATDALAIIHLVGIIEEHADQTFDRVHVAGTRQILAAARQARVRRYIHMSALGTRPHATSRYHQTKWAAEELVRQSGLDFTIFRPSLIHGPDGDFSQMLYGWAHGTRAPWFFMPYFGRGLFGQQSSQTQPIYIDDVANAFAQAVDNPTALHKTYDLVGPQRYTWPELLHIASRILRGKPKVPVAIPAWEASLLLKLHFPVPFTREQLTMALEDNTGDLAPMQADFPAWQPQSLESTMTAYRSQMKSKP